MIDLIRKGGDMRSAELKLRIEIIHTNEKQPKKQQKSLAHCFHTSHSPSQLEAINVNGSRENAKWLMIIYNGLCVIDGLHAWWRVPLSKHVHTLSVTRTLICMSNIYLRVILIFNGAKDEIYHYLIFCAN